MLARSPLNLGNTDVPARKARCMQLFSVKIPFGRTIVSFVNLDVLSWFPLTAYRCISEVTRML